MTDNKQNIRSIRMKIRSIRIAFKMRKTDFIFNFLLLPLDFLMFILAGASIYFLRISPWLQEWREVLFLTELPFHKYFGFLLLVAFAWLLIAAAVGLYRSNFRRGGVAEIIKVGIASGACLTFVLTFIVLRQEWFNSRFLIFGGGLFVFSFISLERIIFRRLYQLILEKYGWVSRRILLIGKSEDTLKLLNGLINNPSLGYRVVKHLPSLDISEICRCVDTSVIDEIVVADFSWSRSAIAQVVNFCEEKQIGFRFAPDLFQSFIARVEVDNSLGLPILELKRTPLEGWGRILKRLVDIFGALTGIIFLMPLGFIIALAVKLDSEGPVLVKLKRVGRGKGFYLYKFRSMIKDAHSMKFQLSSFNERGDGPLFKIKNDPRITRMGRILRKTRIDEFPQLINVLKGEMSLVGPRPHEPEEVAKYEHHHKRTFFVKAGMTGLAQIQGSSDLPFEEEVRQDTTYIKNWSLWLDFKIILKTFLKLFSDRSAC